MKRLYAKGLGGGWALLMSSAGRRATYGLLCPNGVLDQHLEWTWADVDARRERLLWAEAGALHGARISSTGLGESRELFDACAMSFENLEAPYDDPTVIASGV